MKALDDGRWLKPRHAPAVVPTRMTRYQLNMLGPDNSVATGWTVRKSNPSGDEAFPRPSRPADPASYAVGTGSLSRG